MRIACASLRLSIILLTHKEYTDDIPNKRRAFAVGAVSNT